MLKAMEVAAAVVLLVFILGSVSSTAIGAESGQEPEELSMVYRLSISVSSNSMGATVSVNPVITFSMNVSLEEEKASIRIAVLNVSGIPMAGKIPAGQVFSATVSYEDLLNVTLNLGEELGGISEGSGEIMGGIHVEYRIVPEGKTTYNGYPAYKYSFTLRASGEGEDVTASGVLYIHTAYPFPVYYRVNSDISSGLGTASVVEELELVDSNLPKSSTVAEAKASPYRIIVSGPQGLDVMVRGEKGSNKLLVENRGNKHCFIYIVEEGLEMESSITSVPRMHYYHVAPGETRELTLPKPLEKGVEISTETRLSPASIAVAATIMVIIAAVTVLRVRRG